MNDKIFRSAHRGTVSLAAVAFMLMLAAPGLATAQPAFSKSFAPGTIGPGSASLLVFTIENTSGSPVTGMGFTDTLPPGMALADPAVPTTDCGLATLTAPDGGGSVTFSDGEVAADATCTVEVLVTSSSVGTHTNTSGDLSSSAGNSGPATADLTVATDRPGFTKSFSPSSVPFGSRSTLTFTIDNSANGSQSSMQGFTDILPADLVVADPANASTSCDNGTVTAVPGSDTISLGSGASVPPEATCTVTVDVVAGSVGELDNVSGELLVIVGFFQESSGLAVDTLESTAGDIVLVKEFLADPVPPGGTVDLEFTILNRTRSDDATDIAFTDNLGDAGGTLSGLAAVGLPTTVCGGTVSGTTSLTFTGGFVAAEGECSFTVTLQVPAGATPGIYPNTTSNIEADLGFGEPSFGNQASDDLFVFAAPVVEKTFLDNPVAAGGSTRMEFTITNTSATSSATDIAFTDDLTAFLGTAPTVSSLPAAGFCGAGSSISYSGVLSITGAELAAAGSCTFEVTVDIPAGFPGGIYTNVTSEVTATVDGDSVTGSPASADLEVLEAPQISKSFTDDPVLPGGTVTLEFTLEHDEFAPGDATAIAFDDDLDAALSGLVATGLPQSDVCGSGSSVSGTSSLSFTGGTLAPGETCTFSVTLQVPPSASPGTYANATSTVTATVSGLAATGLAATDDLLVTGLSFTKQFVDDPVIAGDTAILRFTIRNDGSADATNMFFTDNLDDALSGLAVTGVLPADPCGSGSSITGTNSLTFGGGNLLAGTFCTFDVAVQVPATAPDGQYLNATSAFSASEGGSAVSLPPATDILEVDSTFLSLSKQFIGDPVQPGDTLTLEIGVSNQSATETVSSIALTDDLDAALSGMTATNILSNDCGFTASGLGTGTLSLSGGSLAAAASCTVVVETQVPAAAPAGLFTNTTSEATGDVGGLAVTGNAASDDFRVVATNFTKSFDGPATATGSAVLTFTLTNLDETSGISALAFTDDLDAVLPGLVATGLPASDVCGAGSSISGTDVLTFSGGELAAAGNPGDSCSFSVTVDVPAGAMPGMYSNATSQLTSGGLVVNDPATANLVIEPPPTFSKVFMPNAIAVGGTTTLTFTIDNTASALAASDLDFTDNLPAGLAVAATPNASTTCTGGTLTATPGAGSLGYTGGSVAADASCTVQVDITGTTEGTFVNTSGALTSSSGDSGTATDTIDVVSGDFVFTKSFRTQPVLPGGLVEMELSVVNGSTFPLTDISFTDDLGATLTGLAAEGTPFFGDCGTGSELSGSSVITLTGGNLAAGASCTIVVPVRVPTDAPAGSFPNTTSTATAVREGVPVDAPPATADLEIALAQFDKSLTPSVTVADSNVTLSFSISNPDPANSIENVTFTDDLDAFVSGMTATGTPTGGVCGAGSSLGGTSTLNLTGATLSAGGSCNFQVTVNVPAGAADGLFTNTTSPISGDIDGNAISIEAASADLEIEPPPAFTKAFAPDTIGVDGVSTLTFTIDNTDSTIAASDLAFTDALPTGMTVAATPNASNTCGGTLTAAADSGSIQLSGGSVAAEGACTLSVDVTASAEGSYNNVSDPLTSSSGDSSTASAVLQVADTEFTVSKAFSSQAVIPGDQVDLEITIDNSSAFALNDIALNDDLEAALTGLAAEGTPLVDACGAGSQLSGTSVITLTGGNLAAGASCTIVVPVRVPTDAPVGSFTNTTSAATAVREGVPVDALPASADLEIEPPPTFTKAFAPDTIGVDGISTLTFTIDNTDSIIAANDLAFTDPLPDGVSVAATPNTGNTCGGTLTATADSGSIQLSAGSVADGGSCTLSVDVTASAEGSYTNVSGPLTSSNGDSGTASAVLEVTGTGFAVSKAFSSQPVIPGGRVDLEITIDNNSAFALSDIALNDDLEAALTGLAAEGLPLADVCGTGSEVSGTGVVDLSGGSLAAGESCTVVIPLRVPADASTGTFENTTGTATGTREGIDVEGPPASADLVVEALGFEKTIAPANTTAGSTIDITFVISNPDPVNSVEGLTFSDDLDAFIPGLTSDDTPQSDVCGAGSLLDGTSVLELSDGIVPPSGSCTISVAANIPADTATGDYTNQTSVLSGQAEGSAFESAGASAPLGVSNAPGFTKAFSPDQVGPDQTSTLTFTIDNSVNTTDADSLAFVDPLPSGMRVASEPNVSNTCGGTLSAAAGAETISLTNGSVAAGAQCTISVDIISSVGGTRTNVTDDLTSSLGNSGPASASLIQFLTVPAIDIKWMLALAMLLMLATWLHFRKY